MQHQGIRMWFIGKEIRLHNVHMQRPHSRSLLHVNVAY